MKNQGMQQAKRLIESRADLVNFGSEANAVGEEWVVKAEQVLGRKLSISYKWFLQNYAGGEVGGEEIYSIYGIDFETVNGGDIVFQYLVNQKAALFDPSKLVVSETDLGEVFFFDYTKFDGDECPIYLRLPSGDHVLYAKDFYEFLIKRIEVHSVWLPESWDEVLRGSQTWSVEK